MGDSPTYQHGIGSSQIDYIFARSENLVTNLIISDRDTCNTSSLVPVCCTLNYEIYQVKTTTELPTSQRRLLWKDSNTELFRTTLQHAKYPKIERPDQIKTFVDQLNDNLLTAARRAVPSKQIRLKGPKWKASPAVRELLQQGKDITNTGWTLVNHALIIL
jgi:hypothetical protein